MSRSGQGATRGWGFGISARPRTVRESGDTTPCKVTHLSWGYNPVWDDRSDFTHGVASPEERAWEPSQVCKTALRVQRRNKQIASQKDGGMSRFGQGATRGWEPCQGRYTLLTFGVLTKK